MDISIIKDIRASYNLTREDFAKKLNITVDTLNTWEYRTKKIPKRKDIYIKKVFFSFFKEETSITPDNYYTTVKFYEMKDLNGSANFDLGEKQKTGSIDISPNDKKRIMPTPTDDGHYLVVRIDGHSMDDNTKRSISQGEEILIRECEDKTLVKLLYHSKLFVIVSKVGVFIKQITKIENDNITCHSFNDTHKDFVLKIKDITKIYTIEKKVKSNIIF